MLEVNNVSKNYGSKEAVKNVSFTIKPGEVYGFLGHNGAGKTSTIKMCTGLLAPTSGTIKVCGYDISRQNLAAKQRIGYVPENPYLYNKLTGREFVELVSKVYRKADSHAIQADIAELLNSVEMSVDADKLIGSYSQGMRKKITLCAALVHKPKVIFLDEPTNGLDASSARVVKDLFRKSAHEGAAVLFTTHILEIAEKLCDRIGIVHQGVLIVEGTVEEIKTTYRDYGDNLEDIYLGITKKESVHHG
ncbi:MAG: ABC transporter ATP-binding protein [Acholeplasmatales bacterium]|nr:MAG: ABC transporter ATP-binding protein [Acholeplasmatales bacterium]